MSMVVCVALPSLAIAHKDRIFQLSGDGRIEGLDSAFLPASIAVSRRAGGDTEATITLSGKRSELPPCLARLFGGQPAPSIELMGSWWHEESRLPPYLNVSLPKASGERYQLLFNLRTAALIGVERERTSGRTTVAEDVLVTLCSERELALLQRQESSRWGVLGYGFVAGIAILLVWRMRGRWK